MSIPLESLITLVFSRLGVRASLLLGMRMEH